MRLILLVGAVIVLLTSSTPVLAGEPLERVKGTLEAVLAILNDPGLQGPEKEGERKAGVRQIIYDRFNFEEMAKESLGDHWKRLTEKQRKEFVDLFGDLFERSYNRLVLKFLPERETLYGIEFVDGDRALVRTTLVSKKNERLPVDYQLKKKGSEWDLYDVVIDGVSIVGNYRTQFNKIIRLQSYEALVKKMKLKQEEGAF